VTAGSAHTCAIRASRRLYCWGADGQGQLGEGAGTADQQVPVVVGTARWKVVDAGFNHTCGIIVQGSMFCWGHDHWGQLGDGGPNVGKHSPVHVGGFADWVAVSAGYARTCGVRSNGRLYCWGHDGSGALGDGLPYANRIVPSVVDGDITDWVAVSTGIFDTCGLRATGVLLCWGEGDRSGTGAVSGDLTSPAVVAGGFHDWTAVSAGSRHTCGRRSNGRLYCWGFDSNGQLGDGGTYTDRTVPTLVAHRTANWRFLSAGEGHTCAGRRDLRLFCWGDNGDFQLGIGAGAGAGPDTPTAVGRAADWTAVAAGDRHTCARRTNGDLYCWGRDDDGQLGTASTVPWSSTPALVTT
jgi:alpha-tubulin suppressor-like RCC1 family protein